jgi:hypothetical protein
MIRFADDIYIIGLAEEVFTRYDAVRAAVATIGLAVQPAKTKLYVQSTVHQTCFPASTLVLPSASALLR